MALATAKWSHLRAPSSAWRSTQQAQVSEIDGIKSHHASCCFHQLLLFPQGFWTSWSWGGPKRWKRVKLDFFQLRKQRFLSLIKRHIKSCKQASISKLSYWQKNTQMDRTPAVAQMNQASLKVVRSIPNRLPYSERRSFTEHRSFSLNAAHNPKATKQNLILRDTPLGIPRNLSLCHACTNVEENNSGFDFSAKDCLASLSAPTAMAARISLPCCPSWIDTRNLKGHHLTPTEMVSFNSMELRQMWEPPNGWPKPPIMQLGSMWNTWSLYVCGTGSWLSPTIWKTYWSPRHHLPFTRLCVLTMVPRSLPPASTNWQGAWQHAPNWQMIITAQISDMVVGQKASLPCLLQVCIYLKLPAPHCSWFLGQAQPPRSWSSTDLSFV